ncbi:MAG: F0F1 ATP synthase subunit epsilon [Armatimonadetes bacterium]|nr:F0F1 ATP synthase subunit epsilon [Armatimonadota bacterium]MDE2207359.1 F0F1 ATP synthase subunit epsilon [Armatimonadota bacterium]
MPTFQLDLVTPERMVFSDHVQSIVAPGVEGSFGVLAGHASFLTELRVGLISLTLPTGFGSHIATSGGFLQVSGNKVIILADTAELAEEIDVERAQASADRARSALEVGGGSGGAEAARAELERSLNRIRVAQMRLHT